MIWWEASHSSASQHLLPNWASFHVLAISHKHILTWLQLHSLLAQAHGSEQKSLMYVLHSRIRTIGYSAETQANIAGHLPFCSKCKGTSINDVTFWPHSRPCHHFSGWLILSCYCYLGVVVLLLCIALLQGRYYVITTSQLHRFRYFLQLVAEKKTPKKVQLWRH